MTKTIILLIAAFSLASTRLPATEYRIIDLGDVLGNNNIACDINNKGQVVGYSASRAYVWQDGNISYLDPLPGGNSCHAEGINDQGQIVGDSQSSPVLYDYGCIWNPGQAVNDLPTHREYWGPDHGALALDINDTGTVVGEAWWAISGGHRAAIWHSSYGEFVDLGTLGYPGWSRAFAVNDSQQVVGGSWVTDYTGHTVAGHAFLWQDNVMRDLGALNGGLFSWAGDIDNSGQVVGQSNGHAVLWVNGLIQDLGTLDGTSWSAAYGINERGQVVGQSSDHAFVWQDGVMQDLGTLPGWISSHAEAVNDDGTIVGWCDIQGGCHAVIWQPVPEPSGVTMLFCLTIAAAGSAKTLV